MLCEAVLLATILDRNVKRNEHCYVKFYDNALESTSSYKYFPLPSIPPPPPPQKKSNVKVQAPVVQKADSAIHWINLCPVDNVIALCNHLSRRWIVIFPLDSAIQRLNNLCQLDHF